MKKSNKVAAVAAVALAAAAVSGSAFASQGNATPQRHTSVNSATTADGDNVQQGDQTTPDVPGAADTESTASNAHVVKTNAVKAKSGQASESSAGESETGGESQSETTPSDGPGGHEDPPGDVEHEGDNSEQ
ncbi:MAG: hypothetical protein ABJA93_02240 [Sporichthyaceae bacterium]